MPRRTVYFDLTDTADERFDRAIETMLVVLLLFAPLALGTVQAWSEWVVIVLATAMAVTLGLKLLRRPDLRFVWSWTYLPILIVLLLGIVQLLPLPLEVMKAISPQTYRLKSSLLAMIDATPPRMTLSFYPEATLQNLRMLTAISTVYVVALNVVRRAEQIRRMLKAIAAIGTIVAVIAMLHLAFGATRVYGIFGEPFSHWMTGPFISRNHFGQFMNLGLGAAVALLLSEMDELQTSQQRGSGRGLAPAAMWIIEGAVSVMAVGVFLSLSRGAILSLAISAGLAAIVVQRRGMSARLWLLMPVAWVVGLVVIYFGFDLLVGRFEQAVDPASGSVSGRMTIVRDILGAAKAAPILGHGLGSFETVYPMFDSSSSATLAIHAENEYAQALFEGGAIELAMVLGFLLMIARSCVQCIRSAPSPMVMPAVGLGMGILAVALHSLSDFGQHLPANAMLAAVECAMLMNLAAATERTSVDAPVFRRANPGTRAVGFIGAAVILGAVVYDGFNAARAEWRWYEVRAVQTVLQARQWQGSDGDYARMLVAAEDASRARPRDVHYRYWLNFYRFRAISRDRDPQSGQVIFDPRQLEWAEQVAAELRAGIPLCPTYGPNFSLAGQIQRNVLDQAGGERLIRKGFELSRTDPSAAFEAAMLDGRAGDWEPAMAKFEHAAKLLRGCRSEGAIALAGVLKRPELAMRLAGNDLGVVRQVVEVLERSGATEAVAARARLAEMIHAGAETRDASAESLLEGARLAMLQQDSSAAIRYLERALLIDPTRAEWRLQLARALEARGDLRRALEEAQVAQRMRVSGADALIISLRTRPTSTSAPATGGQ